MKKKFYITTGIPYVNAPPHIGHILGFVQSDTIARYHRLKGEEVLLLSGSDENAIKNVQAAQTAGVPIQQFVNENAKLFVSLADKLGINFDMFQKGSNKDHYLSSQKLWELCQKAGDIYKESYEGLYCVGCENFYTENELDANHECFEHPGRKLEKISETNYFFRLSRYQDKLINLLEKNELKIVPSAKKNEILAFLKQPLRDISISRSNERAKNWGVPVPGDESQRIYVWFDALNIYQSGVGFGIDEKKYKKWWPADVHIIGKGIIRFHAVYWPAFLLSAGLSLPKTVFVHGYVTFNGQKMSKSLGNVVDPFELIKKYGADAVRYFFLREIPPTGDGDFTYEKFDQRYNSDLASGIGNLVARVIAMAKNGPFSDKFSIDPRFKIISDAKDRYKRALEEFKFSEALAAIWDLIKFCDKIINEERPWEGGKEKVIDDLQIIIIEIAKLLEPFLPETSEKILRQMKTKKSEPLFPRLS
jgi:methionyl-tRNA synthetase